MATQIETFVRPITRDKLAAVFKSHELIRAFEESFRALGGTLPESIKVAEEKAEAAQETADTAALAADAASEFARVAIFRALNVRMPDVRPGAGVTVQRDAQGYTISATGGGAADFSSENHITANRVFGI